MKSLVRVAVSAVFVLAFLLQPSASVQLTQPSHSGTPGPLLWVAEPQAALAMDRYSGVEQSQIPGSAAKASGGKAKLREGVAIATAQLPRVFPEPRLSPGTGWGAGRSEASRKGAGS